MVAMLEDFERIWEIKRAAQGGLLAISAVHAVGVGQKIVAGDRTDDACIMIFVVAKKPVTAMADASSAPKGDRRLEFIELRLCWDGGVDRNSRWCSVEQARREQAYRW